jgi:hypothetical protein
MSSFVPPAPDLKVLLSDWEEWERGENTPGKVLANLKTHGMRELLKQLTDAGWVPSA